MNISKKVINLAGYSYGATIAFQMALKAEEDPNQYPEIQNTILLEGSHNLAGSSIRLLASSVDEALSDAALQIACLLLFSWHFSSQDQPGKKEQISMLQLCYK